MSGVGVGDGPDRGAVGVEVADGDRLGHFIGREVGRPGAEEPPAFLVEHRHTSSGRRSATARSASPSASKSPTATTRARRRPEVGRPAEGTTVLQHRHVVRVGVGDGEVGVPVSVEVGPRPLKTAPPRPGSWSAPPKEPPPRPPAAPTRSSEVAVNHGQVRIAVGVEVADSHRPRARHPGRKLAAPVKEPPASPNSTGTLLSRAARWRWPGQGRDPGSTSPTATDRGSSPVG